MNRHNANRMTTAIFVIAFSLGFASCSGSPSPTSPATPGGTTPVTQTVMAPPPAGVPVALWRAAFYADGKLHRVKAGQVIHLDVSALPVSAQNQIASQAMVAEAVMKGLQKWDTTPVAGGVNYVVTITGKEIDCGGVIVKTGACTGPSLDGPTGDVTGGVMRFTSLNVIVQGTAGALHEIFRTTGIVENAPSPSVMAASPASTPTPEDTLMLIGRYAYSSLAVFTDK